MAEHPLSVGQQALWFLHRIRPAGTEYNGAASVFVYAELEEEPLRAALAATARRHPMLSSTFRETSAGPVRLVDADRVPPLGFRAVPGADPDEMRALVEEYAEVPFDLTRELPFRFLAVRTRPEETLLVVAAHHIAMDLTSEVLVLTDLLHHYGALVRGEPVRLPPVGDYDDFVADERVRITSPKRERSEEYWKQVCLPLPEDLAFPTDRPRPAVLSPVSATWRTELGPEAGRSVDEAARRLGVTPFVVAFSAFQRLLHRRTGQQDFVVGYTASHRQRPKTRHLAGYLVNTPPFRARIPAGAAFRDLVAETNRGLSDALGHTAYPFAMLPALLRLPRSRSRAPLVQVLFNYLPGRPLGKVAESSDGRQTARIDGYATALGPGVSPAGGYDFILEVIQLTSTSLLGIQYKTDLFDAATVAALGEEFAELLRQSCQDLDLPIPT